MMPPVNTVSRWKTSKSLIRRDSIADTFRWHIGDMVTAGQATWPENPPRCYIDFSLESFDFLTDENGTCYDPFDDNEGSADYDNYYPLDQMAALDYFMDRGEPVSDGNYGWAEPLEYDEYPLEIQCSSCML